MFKKNYLKKNGQGMLYTTTMITFAMCNAKDEL